MFAYVGCYTTKQRNARGDGIHVYQIDDPAKEWRHVQHVGNLVNPSMLVRGRNPRFLYSVHGDEEYATSFAIDPASGFLTVLNRARTGGNNGVHQAIDRSGRFMVVANYSSGTVAVMPIQADGRLADYVQLVKLEGEPGPDRKEQASSHPHHIVFDPSGRFVIVPDKGLDRVFVFHFEQGRLTPAGQGSIAARPGDGPRHAAFHPALPVAWVVNELSSQVTTYAWDAERGSLRPLQSLPSAPADFTGNNSLAEIAVGKDGRLIYCSNRGHDSIAIFQTDPKTGLPSPVGWEPSQGRVPRFICLDQSQQFLYAANEQGDTIVGFHIDPATGRLLPAGYKVHNLSPVTIAFVTRGE